MGEGSPSTTSRAPDRQPCATLRRVPRRSADACLAAMRPFALLALLHPVACGCLSVLPEECGHLRSSFHAVIAEVECDINGYYFLFSWARFTPFCNFSE
mmetsp:Transcript_51933/g.91203  ORF Transcript_51933/g.91203 Transcript_51933/m.91203 type:complete len:99 (-) Transcript_51933:85-381(-)